jgi:hypothetical protein
MILILTFFVLAAAGTVFPFKMHLIHMTFEILATLFGSNYLEKKVEKAPFSSFMNAIDFSVHSLFLCTGPPNLHAQFRHRLDDKLSARLTGLIAESLRDSGVVWQSMGKKDRIRR